MYNQGGRFYASYHFFANFALVSLCFLFFLNQVPLKTSAYFSCVEGIKYKGIYFMLGFVYSWAADTAGNLKLRLIVPLREREEISRGRVKLK